MGRYNASTGLGKLYYSVLQENESGQIENGPIKVVDYVQELSIEFGEELEKAYGSNKVAEIAKSAGETQVSLTFHKLPIDVQKDLLGLIEHKENSNVYGFGKDTGITYTAVAIPRTMEDGSQDWFGLTKGVFTRPNKEGQTKEDGVEFGSDEIEGQFMERKIDGFDEELAVVMAYDDKGNTDGRDTIFTSVFGSDFASATEGATPAGSESTETSETTETTETNPTPGETETDPNEPSTPENTGSTEI
ncbi:major tail protein [Staphylococcus massiliensis]|uniref:major tail protein n=1 Tax=Staphylococcus massiliensis TaxID=555791 RepID=UPI001EDEA470|nr:major tail protein [Staphylococcus massiliensis]